MACGQYELDMTAAKFGACKCGFGRAVHSKEALLAGPPPNAHGKSPRTSELGTAPSADAEYHGPCDHYAVDVSASEFGSCKCGFKKSDHGKPREQFMVAKSDAAKPPPPPREAVAPPPVPASRPQEPEAHHPSTAKKPAAQPCDHFEIDVAGTFGFCKCGHSREEHKQAGTLKEPEPRIFAGAHIQDVKRATIVAKPGAHPGKQAKPCDNYQVDTGGKTFGDCMCGHGKVKHKQFQTSSKYHNNDPDAEEAEPEPVPEPIKIILRDGLHPCAVFELDLKNQGGYGHCICGFSRLDHEHFHKDPEDWVRIKNSLTAPKDFT